MAPRRAYTPARFPHTITLEVTAIVFPISRKGESAMQVLRKLLHGQTGTKKFVARYGTQLYCVRYRDSQTQKKRYTTVELIVAESGRTPPPSRIAAETIIGVRGMAGSRITAPDQTGRRKMESCPAIVGDAARSGAAARPEGSPRNFRGYY